MNSTETILGETLFGWLHVACLPFLFLGGLRSVVSRNRLRETFADRFRREVLPPFAAQTAQAGNEDLARLDVPADAHAVVPVVAAGPLE